MFKSEIVSTDWLAQNQDAVRVLDIRGHVIPASEPPPHYFAHHDAYLTAHIPGALFVDWKQDIVDPTSPNGMEVAPPAAFAALMSRLGVDDETPVVIYDDAESMFAARLWWALRYYGHEAVAVLDGGWNKWMAEGRPITDDVPAVEPATFTPRPNPALRRDADAIADEMDAPTVKLVDVRSLAEYNGESSRARRKGHIPGALHLPRRDLLADNGTIPAPLALRDAFQQAGIQPGQTVVTYCNAGVSASYVALTLKLAGVADVAVYDGSWKDWANDDSRPITKP